MRPLTRRDLLERAALGGAALSVPGLLAACGGSGGIEGSGATTAAGTAAPADTTLADTLRMSNWPLYIDIDEKTKKRPTLEGMRACLRELTPPAEVCLVDGFRLGPSAPAHTAVVDGDEKSAAIAAASIVAKVTRDRYMWRADAVYPHYGFSSHVGYITPAHSAVVRERGPSEIHRRSFNALCYAEARD